jgi:uncharacterized protein
VKHFGLTYYLLCVACAAFSQVNTRTTYHDLVKQHVKEIYHVKDNSSVFEGSYTSHFLNGKVASKGQFHNNETIGVWEFYYETGNLKMRGELRANVNYGVWEYFYESGQKSMEGALVEKQKAGEWKMYFESGHLKESGAYKKDKREGVWKTFFEDGKLRGEIEYKDEFGRYIEYYHSGKVFGEGPKVGVKNVGLWRFFAEDGTLESEGEYANGVKNGEWKSFYPSGKISSIGLYDSNEPNGAWTYFFEDGKINSKGEFVGGQKNGYWASFSKAGAKRSEVTYRNGAGEYSEYYDDGKLKKKGQLVDEKNQGKWRYFSTDGKVEGECEFDKGKGTYLGYYPNGALQTKGQMENDLRIGTWELYEKDGKLAGYYKPFYDDAGLAKEITDLLVKKNKIVAPKPTRRKGFHYFAPRFPEYHGVIVAGNPAFSFIGFMPISIEFYNQERLGHEFSFEGLRDPFFTADADVPQNKVFQRGSAISVKQKFYNPMKTGMWYFGHQVRFTNVGNFANIDFPLALQSKIIASATEQRIEYGVLAGIRLMKKNNGNGFTIDAFAGYNVGYRSFDIGDSYRDTFSSLNQSTFSQSINFGLNFGYSVSFDGRR